MAVQINLFIYSVSIIVHLNNEIFNAYSVKEGSQYDQINVRVLRFFSSPCIFMILINEHKKLSFYDDAK